MNLIQSGEGLNRKRLKFLKEEGVLSANRVQHTATNLTAVSTLPAYPADYGFASLHKQMSQFLEINLSHESHIYVYTHTCIYIYMYTHTHTHILLVSFLWRTLIQLLMQEFGRKLCSWRKSYVQSRQHIKKQRHYFANKGTSSQSCGFSSSHVWMWELDYKESWAPKN